MMLVIFLISISLILLILLIIFSFGNTDKGSKNDINKTDDKPIDQNDNDSLPQKYKIKPTLGDGNCFYSAIYRSLNSKNQLANFCDECINTTYQTKLNCSTEENFIRSIRNLLINDTDYIGEYKKIFNFMIDNFKDPTYINTFQQILKDMGDVRNILIKYQKEGEFSPENLDQFIEDIKKVTTTYGSWVGQIEVKIVEKLLSDCGLDTLIFVGMNSLKKYVSEKHQDDDNKILLLLRGNHYEYI
jgi:hypothetical protein